MLSNPKVVHITSTGAPKPASATNDVYQWFWVINGKFMNCLDILDAHRERRRVARPMIIQLGCMNISNT